MSIPVSKNESKPLMDLIESIGETEWRKGSASEYVVRERGIWVLKSQCHHPPSVSFRFKQENPDAISRLKRAVESYVGKVSWVLSEYKRETLPGVNWTIGPVRLWEVREKARKLDLAPNQYLAKYEPEFGPLAFEDLPALVEHIRHSFPELE